QRQGPVSWEQLRQLATSGQLQPADKVWTKGMPKAVTAQEVEGLFAPPNPEEAAAAKRPRVPLWRRATDETKEIAAATLVQTIRPLRFGRNLVRGRWVCRHASETQMALGQKLYELQLGDADLRAQVRDLGEQAHNVTTKKGAAQKLITERKQLLVKLADPSLVEEMPPSGAELEHASAREAQGKLHTYKEQMQADRRILFPADKLAWRRVGIGYGALACTALLIFFLLPSSKSKEDAALAQGPGSNRPTLRLMKTDEIYAAYAKSVCLIKSDKSLGTGFLIRPGVVATNAHVLGMMPVEKFRVTFPSAGEAGAKPLEPKLLYYDSKRDLAFLKIETPLEHLWLAEGFTFKPGQDITVIGNPGIGINDNLSNAVSKGVMSTEKVLHELKFYQLDISVNPGNSGGPVFDSMGQVIGVVTLKAGQERISFSIPLADLHSAVSKVDKQTPNDIDKAASRHNFEMVFMRMAFVGEIYSLALDDYMKRILAATSVGRSPQPALEVAQRIWQPRLRKGEEMVLRDVQPLLGKVGNDKNLSEEFRRKITDMTANIDEMKQYAARMSGDVKVLDAKVKEMRDKHRTIVESLRLSLGVEKDDMPSLEDS
ncbi:MAG TPA: trypsin-like peptidase domain-containing protein, partial [Isosphaeraceae bacterium]|nr:trypsin-like peptidase domain-containing protein [Isosphaeraceae bacterium]